VFGAMLLTAVVMVLAGRMRRAKDGEYDSDALGFVGGVLNALFIVVLAFYTVITWTDADAVAQGADTEAANLVDVYWQAANAPKPNQVRALVTEYATEVADREWPLLADGKPDQKADDLLVALRTELMRLPVDSDDQLSLRDKAADDMRTVSDLHRARVSAATSNDALLEILLLSTILGAVSMIVYPLVIGFSAGVRHVSSMVFMAGLLAFIVYFSFELDGPFSGLISVDPDAFRSAVTEMGKIP
jgi:hypothetical protein